MLLRQLKEWDPIDPILSADTMYTEIICFYLSTINWYLPSWRNGKATCRMLSTPRWANASNLPPGTFFFNFLFDFQILYFLPFFSSSGSRATTREAAEERAEGFPRFSHFSHVENSQEFFWENLLFGSGLFLTLKFFQYCCSWHIAIIYSTLKKSPKQTKRAANNWVTRKHLKQQSENLLKTNL